MKLTSEQIKWEGDATYAIVAIDDNVVEEQIDFDPSLNVESLTSVGAYDYGGVFHYQVKRELKQIKPTVSHCVRVYEGGYVGVTPFKLIDLGDIVEGCLPYPHTHHYNGKQKFRLVYKES